VSHGLATVREMSTKCLWLDHGKLMAYGPSDEVVDAYETHTAAGTSAMVTDEL
jgi:ABC-type polysaccharide/polyol phosphate transport system ATPase subunit